MTVLDAILLVAATAIGLALVRMTYSHPILRWKLEPFETDDLAARTLLERIGVWVIIMSPLLVAWTVVLPILRWIPPRPAPRRLLRQPGMVACGGGVLIMVAGSVINILMFFYYGFAMFWDVGLFEWQGLDERHVSSAQILTLTDLRHVGLFVAVAWSALALTGRWRPAPDWVDRLGRAIGFAWIVTFPAFLWLAVWRLFDKNP
jgi:hypothetical protein